MISRSAHIFDEFHTIGNTDGMDIKDRKNEINKNIKKIIVLCANIADARNEYNKDRKRCVVTTCDDSNISFVSGEVRYYYRSVNTCMDGYRFDGYGISNRLYELDMRVQHEKAVSIGEHITAASRRMNN